MLLLLCEQGICFELLFPSWGWIWAEPSFLLSPCSLFSWWRYIHEAGHRGALRSLAKQSELTRPMSTLRPWPNTQSTRAELRYNNEMLVGNSVPVKWSTVIQWNDELSRMPPDNNVCVCVNVYVYFNVKHPDREFLGSLVVRNWCFYQALGFDPWWGNKDPASWGVSPSPAKKKALRKIRGMAHAKE